MTEQETRLRELIEQSHRIAFFGGAGVSTESNVPDFRSDEGLYAANQQRVYPYPPETMLSHSFLCGIRSCFISSILTRWFTRRQSRTRRIWPWPVWNSRAG